MVNFNIILNMYDEFIDKDVLGTQDLLRLGLNKNDLTKLVSDGKLVRPKKGQYAVGNVDGLLYYSKVRFGKRKNDGEKARKALWKAAKIDPNNGTVQTRLFLNGLIDENLDQALESFAIMDKTENEFYKQDQNMWLYLLSFIKELPEEYKERVSKMTYDDIKVLPGDLRYQDKLLQERLRHDIMSYSFKRASNLSHLLPEGEKKLNAVITEVLLGKAINETVKLHNSLYGLIDEHKYKDAIEILTKEKEIHGLSKSDNGLFMVLNDLVVMQEENRVLDSSKEYNSNNIYSVIEAKDYEMAERLHKEWLATRVSKSKSAVALDKLLEEAKNEVRRLNGPLVEDVPIVEVPKKKKDVVGNKLFTDIAISLMQQDVDTATGLIGEYLGHIDKAVYKDYVNDLVQLSVLNNDSGFVEAMEALADLAKDEFEMMPAVYLQDFYYNLARKKFHQAALYLDILRMSESLGGVKIGVAEMKNRLLEDAAEVGYTEEDLGLKKKAKVAEDEKIAMLPADKVLSVADVMYTALEKTDEADMATAQKEEVVVAENEGETVVPQEEDNDSFIEEPSQVTYTVLDVVDRLLEDTNLIMLEPMSEEDIERVVETTASFQEIQTYVLEEETGEKRVVLRYYNPNGEYINFKDVLRLAHFKFSNGDYDEAIDLFQEVLPRLEKPKPFIYAKLGTAYERLGEYNKAIDYYTVAEAQSGTDGDTNYSFSKKVNALRKKCEYNGVSVLREENTTGSNEAARQYVKENKNN